MTCLDCRHEVHPGIVCGQQDHYPGQLCFCQAPPCRHPGFAAVREFGGAGGFGEVVGYVCVDCHGPFEVEEVEHKRPDEEPTT